MTTSGKTGLRPSSSILIHPSIRLSYWAQPPCCQWELPLSPSAGWTAALGRRVPLVSVAKQCSLGRLLRRGALLPAKFGWNHTVFIFSFRISSPYPSVKRSVFRVCLYPLKSFCVPLSLCMRRTKLQLCSNWTEEGAKPKCFLSNLTLWEMKNGKKMIMVVTGSSVRFSAQFCIQKSVRECHCYMWVGRGGLTLVERPEEPVQKQLPPAKALGPGLTEGVGAALVDPVPGWELLLFTLFRILILECVLSNV